MKSQRISTDSGTDVDLDIPGSLSDTSDSPSSPIDLEQVEVAQRASRNPQVSTADSVNRRRRAMG
jgi:hypothetical protein